MIWDLEKEPMYPGGAMLNGETTVPVRNRRTGLDGLAHVEYRYGGHPVLVGPVVERDADSDSPCDDRDRDGRIILDRKPTFR